MATKIRLDPDSERGSQITKWLQEDQILAVLRADTAGLPRDRIFEELKSYAETAESELRESEATFGC